MDRTLARRLIFGSAAIGSLGTFAMHLVLPALPDIREHFASSLSTTQLLVSLALLAIAGAPHVAIDVLGLSPSSYGLFSHALSARARDPRAQSVGGVAVVAGKSPSPQPSPR